MVYELEDKNEESAFYELDSHRGVAVVGAAIVENHLTAVLKAAMRQDESALQELFRSSGPLGTFGTKIRLAYLLRLIHEDLYNDLLIVSRIRNAFAHDVKISSFEEQSIRAKIENLKAFKVWRDLAQKYGGQAKEQPSDFQTRLTDSIVNDEMSTMRDSFRMCLRLYIWKLVRAEKAVREWSAIQPVPTPQEENAV